MRCRITILFLSLIVTTFISCSKKEEKQAPVAQQNQYGLAVDSLIEVHGTIEKNQTLSDILTPHGVDPQKINAIAQNALPVFPVRNFRTGDDYYIYAKWDSVETLQYFVYVRNAVDYVVFDLRDSINIYHAKKDVVIKELSLIHI
jgi:hypothetical protein